LTTEQPPADDPRSEQARKATRRTWLAIGLGTVVQVVSSGALLFGTLVSVSDEEIAAGPSFALGFILAPVAFAVVAFVSGRERAPIATLKAMGIWLVLALTLGLLNPVAGLCVAYGAAGSATLRREDWTSTWTRSIAVVLTGIYVLVLVVVLPEAGIFAGAVTPLLSIRAADVYQARAVSQ
jgi:FtsH-binding integral membrane protein